MQVERLKVPFTRYAHYTFDTNADPTYIDSFVTATAVSPGAGLTLWEPANNPTPVYDTAPVLRVSPTAATTAAAAVSTNAYFQFTISAVSGLFVPIMLCFRAGKGGTSSPRGYVVRSDDDSYAANLATADLTTVRPFWTEVHLQLNMAAKSSLAFRIYVYTPTSGASIEFDNIAFFGVKL